MTDDLTISQALREAKTLKNRLSELKDRLKKSTVFQEGDEPAFAFEPTLESYTGVSEALCQLEARIAVANATAMVRLDDRTAPLAQAVRRLAELKAQIALTRELPTQAKVRREEQKLERFVDDHYDSKNRLVTVITHCVFTEVQKAARVAELQARFDRLNNAVEAMNNATKLPKPHEG